MARFRALIVFVVAGAAPLVACNAIIGLSDFTRGSCNGGGDCLNDAGDAGDGGTNEGGTGAQPVSWPRWPMPGYADAGRPPTYTIIDANTATETITGLTWQRKALGISTFADAQKACAALSTPTAKWRLPKRIELVTLLDFSQTGGAALIDPTVFPAFPANTMWTSSESRTVTNGVVTVTDSYWTIQFQTGAVQTTLGASNAGFALCVQDK